jgi:hypothetical protein
MGTFYVNICPYIHEVKILYETYMSNIDTKGNENVIPACRESFLKTILDKPE